MRILGYEIRKAKKGQRPPRPSSRPSWVNPFDSAFSSYMPGNVDLELYRAIKEGIPIVDVQLDLSGRITDSDSDPHALSLCDNHRNRNQRKAAS